MWDMVHSKIEPKYPSYSAQDQREDGDVQVFLDQRLAVEEFIEINKGMSGIICVPS
jgi:hypothetical protein